MIDRQKRDRAASLIEQFLNGDIDSDELQSGWPDNREDRALDEIDWQLWYHYDDFKPRRMTGTAAASPEEREDFGRCIDFLRSDLPYRWPDQQHSRIDELGVLVPLTLGLLGRLARYFKKKNERFDAAMDAAGDISVWPFTSRSEWNEARLRQPKDSP